ncbi:MULTISPECIES: hypothetical protein [Pantoea]|jgi:hypothetical protein|uniref:Uncharacterized protein n=1 Tax=Pantoea brenneri TaxID=472694 RepID=A0A7Y6NH46_9GAMM|nr:MULTISPECIES: hypothetical protein [Pantoea]MBZ6396975.1 hypothetical protein [Pantoea sp.]MBZ6440274.1 hypothetical protein [Pantoea sp.]NUY43461.1 hypothetical protein [Pantoea brenneri]NUY50973.1 hypothetical protein [Pantoea brenneri]NUY61296.1 hypothetical protein [Pantoea brenneri]
MSAEAQKQYYLLLSHLIESTHHKPLTVQVMVARDTPNLTQLVLKQASQSAIRNAQDIMPGIDVTAVTLTGRIELGYMTAAEFDAAVDSVEPEAEAV